MKKLTALLATIFTVATLFAAARPSLDGRAQVCEEGSMPRGLFARTVGYLPGDSVTVTNPLNGKVIDVLILGAIDPSEGVAILLSNEAANALDIEKDSNVQVKITKRTGRLDEIVNGEAILASTENSSESEADSVKEEIKAPEPVVETTPEPVAEAVEKVEELPSGNGTDAVAIEENVVPEPVVPVTEPQASVKEPVAEPVKEDKIEEIVKEDPVPEEKFVADDVFADEDDGNAVKVTETVEVIEVVEVENPNELEADFRTAVAAEKEEISAEYTPIVLVPSDSNPPKVEETEVVETVETSPVPTETPIVVQEEKVEVPAEETAKAEPKEDKKDAADFTKYIVPSLKDLRSGSYYIQIATLGSEKNILNTIDQYGKNYPLNLVPVSSGKAYQVMIGPLNADEYGAVMKRFKDFGYKDCFLRKIR